MFYLLLKKLLVSSIKTFMFETANFHSIYESISGFQSKTAFFSLKQINLFHFIFETGLSILVGVAGLEPAASWSRTKHATKLRYTPKTKISSRGPDIFSSWLPD